MKLKNQSLLYRILLMIQSPTVILNMTVKKARGKKKGQLIKIINLKKHIKIYRQMFNKQLIMLKKNIKKAVKHSFIISLRN